MGLSTCAKGFIACGVCTAVVLAVLIPVGILVIAPNMGQHALDSSVMNIPNATVYNLPDDLTVDPVANLFNNVVLTQDSMPFSAKLHETQLVMHVSNGSFGGAPYNATNLAYFTMPEQTVKHGVNEFSVSADINVLNPDVFVWWAFNMLFGVTPTVTMYVAGKPKLSAFGFISMDLKLGKALNCSYVPDYMTNRLVQESSETATAEEFVATARRLVGGLPPITMNCHQQEDMKSHFIDEVLESFTNDLEQYHATTQAPAPAPAPALSSSSAFMERN